MLDSVLNVGNTAVHKVEIIPFIEPTVENVKQAFSLKATEINV
jgi:hypothetical protein